MQKISAKSRIIFGKRVKIIRKEGFLPAVVYGEGIPSHPISVSYKDFEKTYRETGESTLVELEVDGKPYNVLIHDIAHDPLKDTPLHADFYAVRMDKLIRTKIPIEFFGESPAVKNDGGILVKVTQELEIEAFPKDLPRSFRMDISSLVALESKLFIKDIVVPAGVKILADTEDIIILIEPPRSEEELTALEKVTEAAVAEVKTEQEVKKEMQEKDKVEEVAK